MKIIEIAVDERDANTIASAVHRCYLGCRESGDERGAVRYLDVFNKLAKIDGIRGRLTVIAKNRLAQAPEQ